MGGVEALTKLVAQFPEDLPAAIFIVIHVSPHSKGIFAQILDRSGPLMAKTAEDREAIHHGHIYVAPPDYHLLVKQGFIRVIRGPRENRARPAIDPLFRSSAASYSSRVVGVILTGYQDDGTSGLLTVKRCGGIAVIQDPNDAIVPDMPANALENVEVDYCLPISEMGAVLDRLAREPAKEPPPVSEDIIEEMKITENTIGDTSNRSNLGNLVPYSCPECGGSLREMEGDKILRYRCHTGHAYTARALISDKSDTIENALWHALSILGERTNMLSNMARHERVRSRNKSAAIYENRAEESRAHTQSIRNLIMALSKSEANSE